MNGPGSRRSTVIDPTERRLLSLDEPLPAVGPLGEAEMPRAVEEVLRILGVGGDPDPRRALTARLTELGPAEIPEEAWESLDRIWATEAAMSEEHDARAIDRRVHTGTDDAWLERCALWRGDITQLGADAIVNAANSGLTGCYIPFHRCVDNAIHTVAGPRLREDCGLVMEHRRRPEPPGTATATRAWFLPARFVIHTVGPIVDGGEPTGEDEALLRSCYTSCLDVAAQLKDVRSIAFCSISTGVFGYPIEAATRTAVSAVAGWLTEHPDELELVVFVVFSAGDEQTYRKVLTIEDR